MLVSRHLYRGIGARATQNGAEMRPKQPTVLAIRNAKPRLNPMTVNVLDDAPIYSRIRLNYVVFRIKR
jgi:hypothetical protein